jgi:hypothetical protein
MSVIDVHEVAILEQKQYDTVPVVAVPSERVLSIKELISKDLLVGFKKLR